MFGWLEDIIEALGDLLSDIYEGIGEVVSKIIWDTMLKWVYETIYGAIADFFTSINNFGAEMFELGWIKAAVHLFVLFGWALFITGTAVAVFDVAIEYQHGRANVRSCFLNILKLPEYQIHMTARCFQQDHSSMLQILLNFHCLQLTAAFHFRKQFLLHHYYCRIKLLSSEL